jgi:hypothetical protein
VAAGRPIRIAILLDGAKKVRDGLKGTAKDAEGISGALGKVGTAAAAGLAAAAAATLAFAKSATNAYVDAAAKTKVLQRSLGGTAEDASRLGFALQQSGIDSDTFVTGLKTLSKQLTSNQNTTKVVTDSVRVGTGVWSKQSILVRDAAGNFKTLNKIVEGTKLVKVQRTVQQTNPLMAKLGINFRDAAGNVRSMYELLPLLAEKFSKMPGGAEKTALAVQLFGRNAQALLPFLNRGASGIAELEAQADKLGITLTEKDLTAQTAYIKSQRDWNAALQGIKISLGRELFPLLARWAAYLASQGPAINAWARKVGPGIAAALKLAVDRVRTALTWFSNFVAFAQRNSAWMGPLIKGALLAVGAVGALGVAFKAYVAVLRATIVVQAAADAVAMVNPYLLIALAVVALIYGMTQLYQHSARFRKIVDDTGSSVVSFGQDVGKWFTSAWQKVADFGSRVASTFRSVVAAIVRARDAVMGAPNALLQWFADLPQRVGGALAQLPGKAASALGALAKVMAYQAGYIVGRTIRFFALDLPLGVARGVMALPGLISSSLRSAEATLRSVASRLGGAVSSAVSASFGALVNGAQSLGSGVVRVLGTAMGAVERTLIDPVARANRWLLDNWTSLPQRAYDALRNLPAAVGSAISGAVQYMMDAGRNVVRGLTDGIRAEADSAVKSVQDLSARLLKGLKDGLGIASPSKLARMLGRYFPQGLALGILDGKGTVQRAVTSLLDVPAKVSLPAVNPALTASRPVTAVAVASGTGANGGRTYNINVNASAASPADVGREVIKVIRAHERDSGNLVLATS